MPSSDHRLLTLGKLRALVEHPRTSEAERQNAIRRIEEIEERIRATKVEMEQGSAFKNVQPRAQARETFRKVRRRARVEKPKFHDDWPFGWTQPRVPVEYEHAFNRETGDAVVNWKCPSCGAHVTRIIGARQARRLAGQPGGLKSYLERMTNGTMNQLCPECWDLWNKR
jgi:hypothetical protein